MPAPQQTMVIQPVSSFEYERDMAARDRAARRRDPESRPNAQKTLDAAPRVNVILNPSEADRKFGESHLDADGNPRYPLWECTYNGLRLAYAVGVPIEMPVYIYEQYAHNQRMPVFRKAPGDVGTVFSREIPDSGQVAPADFGR